MEFPNTQLLLSRPVIAADSETTGLSWVRDKLFAVSFAWRNDQGQIENFYADTREKYALDWLRAIMPKLRHIVNHHIKFDAHMWREAGIEVPMDRIECTLVRETLIDEDQHDYGLDRLSWKYLERGKQDIWPVLAKMFGGKDNKETQAPNLSRAPRKLVETYANVDSANALEIWEKQQKILVDEDLINIAALEMRLLGVVTEMEYGGVQVDLDAAERAVKFLDSEVGREQKELDRLAGHAINVNSGPQVKTLLQVHQGNDGRWRTGDGVLLEPTDSGKSGSLKTEKLYQSTMPEARYIAEIRAMIKARDVFLKKYILEMNHGGYIHANINQTRTEEGDGTYTGRFSITEPALQQIHKRNKKMAAIVRSCFIPDEGCAWGCYDWSQKDFRIFGHYVNDPKINAIYEADPTADFHRVTAGITGLPRDRDEKTGGANAKQMNLGLIFGMSAGRMAKEMFLPYVINDKGYFEAGPEAQALFSKYHTNIPGAEKLKKQVASVARSRGYIKTQLGRRLRFPGGHNAYKAAGILFQAQAAESMKVKMCELYDLLKDHPDSRLALVVHDEYDVMLSHGRNPALDLEVKNLLERFDGDLTPLHYRIPILSDFGIGKNWHEASK